MSELLPRIVGLENEFAIQVATEQSRGQLTLPNHSVPGLVIAQALMNANMEAAKGGYLPNGGRLYHDYNNKVEYATPECATFADAIHAEMAGLQLVLNGLQAAAQRGFIKRYTVNARVIDELGNTWGHHENYLIAREAFRRKALRRSISSHIVSRNVLVGAGLWKPTDYNPARVIVAQKILGVKTATDSDTVRSKPIFNTRDEAHSDRTTSARLHVVSGDATISPWAGWLALGTTSLVCRLTELDFINSKAVTLRNVVQAGKDIAYRPDIPVQMSDGRMLCAIDIQEILAEQSAAMAKRVELPMEEHLVLEEWQRAIDDYRRDPESLADRTEWIARRHFMRGLAERKASLPRKQLLDTLQKGDQLWDNLKPGVGVAAGRREKMGFPGYDEDAVEALITEPVKNTRAYLRGRLLKAATSGNCRALFGSKLDSAAWTWLKFANERQIRILNPRTAVHPRYEAILEPYTN